MIRICLADDHTLIRTGLRTLIETEPGISVISEASTADDALQCCLTLSPDILLLDLSMPGIPVRLLIASLAQHETGTRNHNSLHT